MNFNQINQKFYNILTSVDSNVTCLNVSISFSKITPQDQKTFNFKASVATFVSLEGFKILNNEINVNLIYFDGGAQKISMKSFIFMNNVFINNYYNAYPYLTFINLKNGYVGTGETMYFFNNTIESNILYFHYSSH